MDQLVLVSSVYFRGAIEANLGGQVSLAGFAHGVPILQVSPVGTRSIDTTEAVNTLTPQDRSTMYGNTFNGSGEVQYTLPSPTSAQALSISNSGGRANPLRIVAPTGASIRWLDGTLHSAIVSDGNQLDNAMFIGESDSIWRVTYAGEADSHWTTE